VRVAVESFASAALLPPDARSLFDNPESLFASRFWWAVVLSDAMPRGATAVFLLCRIGGAAAALVPLLRTAGRLDSLTTPYSCRYTPVFASGLDRAGRVAAMAAVARFCRVRAITRLEALPAEWDGLPDLLTGCRQAGLWPLRFDHFGNWYEDVAGLDWAGYLARRPGALRETIRRRLRRAERMPDARFDLLTDPAQMDTAAAAFEQVYARSWKLPEPFPTFNVTLMRAMAACGVLRFGLWSIGDAPVAVQIWALRDGQATVLKLAHDEAFKADSPGTVLTALMLRHLLNQDHVRQIDFGRGDDPYKRDWAAQRRQRIGLLLVNPWRPDGAAALLRHAGGRLRAALRPPPT
jgi:CelD/BcsL family acetyltransferase involved in cellulose biosynthesis